MKPNQTLKIILLIFISFATYYLLFSNFKSIKVEIDKITQQGLISYILSYLVVGIPIFLGTFLIDKRTSIIKSFGLSANILTAVWTSILFTLPMFLGRLSFFKFIQQIDIENAENAYLMITNIINGTSNNYVLDVSSSSTTIDLNSYPIGNYSVTLVCNGQIVESKGLIKN